MRILSATAILALVLSPSASLAQAEDHASHHPEGAVPAPDAKPAPAPSDKTCPMMGQMQGGSGQSGMQGNMSGHSEQDMKAMQEMMKKCMEAKSKDGSGTDHQH